MNKINVKYDDTSVQCGQCLKFANERLQKLLPSALILHKKTLSLIYTMRSYKDRYLHILM